MHRRLFLFALLGPLLLGGCLLVLTFEGDLWLVQPSAEKFSKITEWKGAIQPVPWWTGNGGKGPSK